jgi:hypothetical protein
MMIVPGHFLVIELDHSEQCLTKIPMKMFFERSCLYIFTNEHPICAVILSNSNIVTFVDNGNDCCINIGPISKLLIKKYV